MNPYQPGEDNQDPYEVGYKAGAASRDAEVVSLTNQRDYEYVRAENAEQERDQLREQIASLKDELRQISTAIDDVRLDLTNTAAELIMEMKEQLSSRDAEVAELKSVPMKYRRMAFNAKLQDEISELRKFVQEQDELLQECRPIIKTAENVRKERDQLREQVKMLRDAIEYSGAAKSCQGLADALAATEPKE